MKGVRREHQRRKRSCGVERNEFSMQYAQSKLWSNMLFLSAQTSTLTGHPLHAFPQISRLTTATWSPLQLPITFPPCWADNLMPRAPNDRRQEGFHFTWLPITCLFWCFFHWYWLSYRPFCIFHCICIVMWHCKCRSSFFSTVVSEILVGNSWVLIWNSFVSGCGQMKHLIIINM